MINGIFLYGVNTEDEVLEILRTIQSQKITNGGTTISQWSSEGTSVTKFNSMKTEDLLNECIYFLRTNWPERYGRIVKKMIPRYL
jgi:hypothetical protein